MAIRHFAIIASLLLAAGCSAEVSDSDDSESVDSELSSDARSKRVLVYSNNIENMVYDWKDLISFMKVSKTTPDVFLVQQMTDLARLNELTKTMTSMLGVKFEGRVAQDNPTNLRQGSEVTPNPTVTTGIIFRAARFDVVSQEVWFSIGNADPVTGAPNCTARHESSSYQTIKLHLHDKLAKRDLAVVSLRHPTNSPCAAENILDIESHLSAKIGLTIVGGDFNDNPTETHAKGDCWYHSMVGRMNACAGRRDLHFADPLFDLCKGDMACVKGRQGIDHIFGRYHDSTPAQTSNDMRISFDQGDAANIAVAGRDEHSNTVAVNGFVDASSDYSHHRARVAAFAYPDK